MSASTEITTPARQSLANFMASPGEKSLEDLLAALATFGKPRLSLQPRGWHACVEMHVSAVGVSFDVNSDFDHKTPSAAARQCAERVLAALNGLA